MKIKLKDLELAAKVVDIVGSEDWLAELYQSFPAPPKGRDKPLITGALEVKSDGYGYASLKGHLTFSPYVTCSRCADPIQWNLDRDLVARFKPKDDIAEAREVDLVPEDLDFYYIEDGTLDLLQVLIDSIVGWLPSQLVKRSKDGKSCVVCNEDISDTSVYRSKTKEEESPFAALKNLKLPN